MRKPGKVSWLGVLLVVLAGCKTNDVDIKPKYQPSECVAPPQGDPRYDSYVKYPKETLFNDVIKKNDPTMGGPQGPGRFGAGGPGGRPAF